MRPTEFNAAEVVEEKRHPPQSTHGKFERTEGGSPDWIEDLDNNDEPEEDDLTADNDED